MERLDERVRIDAIRVRELELPLWTPFRISGGVMARRRSLIVEIHSRGEVGYGESAPCEEPFYSEETTGTVLALYRELYLPRLRGRTFESIDAFDAEIRRGVRANPFARAGLENAYWDLCCRQSGISLVEAIARRLRALGLEPRFCAPLPAIESGVAVGIPEDEEPATLAGWIDGYLREGYRRVKIKVCPGWDQLACRTARDVVGGGFPLWCDANASFDLERDSERLRSLDDFGLLFLEQPLHHQDLLDHSKLALEVRTPICLDESLSSLRAARQAVELRAARVWNIKVQRLGGLSEAIGVYRLAAERGIEVWGGTMPESGIGSQAILALAAFPGFVYPADVEPSARWYESGCDPVEIAMDRGGRIAVPRARGIEEILQRDRYERHSRPVLE